MRLATGSRLRRQEGQSMVMFAVVLPLVLFIAVLSVDVGNWWVHKRRLQTQVDAAALAGAPLFIECFNESTNAQRNITSEAIKYAGDFHNNRDPAIPGPVTSLNQQVQEPGDVFIVLNSPRYWEPSDGTDPMSPTPGYGLDYTVDADPSTPALDPSDPCSARFLDVKATDDEVSPLWGRIKNWRDFPKAVSPNAKARVEVHPLSGGAGFLPWAVPEANPKSVYALFVNEAETTGVVERFVPLNGPTSPSVTQVLNGETASVWNGLGEVNLVNRNGMIVMTSREELEDADLAGKSLTQICSMPTAACYGGRTNTSGVEFIRGTPVTDPGNGQVQLTTVELTSSPPPGPGDPDFPPVPNTPCSTTDPDSEPYFLYNADCNLRIRAQIEFGSLGSPRVVRVNSGANCTSGQELALRDGWWESNWLPTIDQGTRRNGFSLCWRIGVGGSGPSGNFGGQMMQMTYAANPGATNGSGPMVSSTITTFSSGCTLYGNALAVTLQTVCIQEGLQPPLRLSGADDPPIMLRTAASSLNQMLDCDHSPIGTDMEIRDGCATPHMVNERGLVCEPNPTYTPSNLPLPLPPPEPNPWPDCIEANPGSVTDMSKGLRARFEDPEPDGAGCPENLWDEYRDNDEVPPPEDPRRVTLVVAEYGTFDDTGIKVLPITKFAGFYVTGWFTKNGAQMAQGCADNDPPPTPPFCSGGPCDPGDTKVQGAVWGYYITDVQLEGRPDEDELCDFNDVRTCVAQLVE